MLLASISIVQIFICVVLEIKRSFSARYFSVICAPAVPSLQRMMFCMAHTFPKTFQYSLTRFFDSSRADLLMLLAFRLVGV